jgi:hypothetical protein
MPQHPLAESARMLSWLRSRLTRRKRSNEYIGNLAQEIRKSNLFDIAWYLKANPDVRHVGLDPVEHYLRYGADEGRNPSQSFNTRAYIARNPQLEKSRLNPLIHYLRSPGAEERTDPHSTVSYRSQIAERFFRNEALPVFLSPSSRPRINLVVDTLDSKGLYGAVGTAIVFAVLLANRTGLGLRLVTRNAPPAPGNFQKLIAFHGITCSGEVEFRFASPKGETQHLDITERDLFISTSWWTTSCIRKSVPARSITYLLQEDERIFYPNGDERTLCSETIADPEIRFVVNTKLVFDTLVADGFSNIAKHGVWFEPSFSPIHYHWDESRDRTKLGFLFYARPENFRNLYFRGMEAIAAAIEIGLFENGDWCFNFAGQDLSPVSLPRGIRPVLHQNLAWADYAKLVRSVDLGLCLMQSVHPSYPPLDLAASGAVVLTSRFGAKVSLEQYSANILCSDVTLDALVGGLRAAVGRAHDIAGRRRRYDRNALMQDWSASFAPALEKFQGA